MAQGVFMALICAHILSWFETPRAISKLPLLGGHYGVTGIETVGSELQMH